MEATSGAFQWLANSFYVLVALAVVYLYFFKIVPLVAGKVSIGSLGGVIQLTLILIVIAILIGFVAVRTADWIFINVLDSLPGTRIAEEVNRVTGPMVDLPVGAANRGISSIIPGSSSSPSNTNYTPPPTVAPTYNNQGSGNPSGQGSGSGQSGGNAPAIVLKNNAMSIWAGRIQSIYNETGKFSDNTRAMSPTELPTGVMCQVYATQPERIWRSRANEPWTLHCSNDEFATSTDILVNGTAARGLTGDDFYDNGNRMPVYGAGPWPAEAIERTTVPESRSSSQSIGQPAAASAPANSVQPTSTPAGGPAASVASSLAVENGQRVYTVKRGDNLANIAQTYGVQIHEIVSANATKYPQMASNNNLISPGWELILP